ncbi:hypothetical protein B0H10DRAFT_2219551 [Mycena sp. CBHHK59/15]|nr:hypothetical protein B0H10DRAFT_2219551 [Mycena sp. CBHHK59/15]
MSHTTVRRSSLIIPGLRARFIELLKIDAKVGVNPNSARVTVSASTSDSDMQISHDDEPQTMKKSDPNSMDVDEEPQSDDEQVEVDVLPDAGSDSEASEVVEEGEAEVEEPEEYELEDEDDEIQSRSPSAAETPAKPSLKIKFKLGAAVTRGRRTRATAPVQVESEESEQSESEEEMPQNVRLTKRQAALAKARKGIASSETSIDEESNTSKKRTAIDPSELALRKEESARKRRNVTEKKLQNEKAETINRLLKKQSRPRNKRTMALSTSTPVEIPTPVPPSDGPGSVGDAVEDKALEAEKEANATPTMYRWISTSRAPVTVQNSTENTSRMSITFSVPASVAFETPATSPVPPKPQAPAMCAVAGCGKDRRYRLVGGEWGVGACGMGHLKMLEGQ